MERALALKDTYFTQSESTGKYDKIYCVRQIQFSKLRDWASLFCRPICSTGKRLWGDHHMGYFNVASHKRHLYTWSSPWNFRSCVSLVMKVSETSFDKNIPEKSLQTTGVTWVQLHKCAVWPGVKENIWRYAKPIREYKSRGKLD